MSSSPMKDPPTPPSTMPVARIGGKESCAPPCSRPYLAPPSFGERRRAVRALMSVAGTSSLGHRRRNWGGSRSLPEGARSQRLKNSSVRACSPASTSWLTHPENLGTYVRVLRTASKPVDAYRYLAHISRGSESHRGLRAHGDFAPLVRMTYRLRDDSEGVQRHRLFCDAREGELSSLPRFWASPTRPSSTKLVSRRATQCAPTW